MPLPLLLTGADLAASPAFPYTVAYTVLGLFTLVTAMIGLAVHRDGRRFSVTKDTIEALSAANQELRREIDDIKVRVASQAQRINALEDKLERTRAERDRLQTRVALLVAACTDILAWLTGLPDDIRASAPKILQQLDLSLPLRREHDG